MQVTAAKEGKAAVEPLVEVASLDCGGLDRQTLA